MAVAAWPGRRGVCVSARCHAIRLRTVCRLAPKTSSARLSVFSSRCAASCSQKKPVKAFHSSSLHFSSFLMPSPRAGEAFQSVCPGLRPLRQGLGAVVGSGLGAGLLKNKLGLRTSRRLTLRSNGPPTAGGLGPVRGTLYIFANRAKPACRGGPFSSNVRRRKHPSSRSASPRDTRRE